MSDNWLEYVNDPRTVCKYGSKCYQKNADHHDKFKHPPLKRKDVNRNKRRFSPYTRTANQSPSLNEENDDIKKGGESSKLNEDVDVHNDSSKTKESGAETEIYIPVNLTDNLKYYDKNTDKSLIKEMFLVEMPDEFYKFYEFCEDIGQTAEQLLAGVNLELIGPYDLLLGKLPILEDKELYLVHWRFFYDPPEFQAVLKKKNSEYHIGYFRDDPSENPRFLASNDSSKGYNITLMSETIFGAVYMYLENEKKNSPFTAMSCQKLMDKLKKFAEENKISLEEFSMKKRSSQIVTKSFHGAGVAVPYNKKTQLGYRRLAETDANLKKMFNGLENAKSKEDKDKILSDLQIVITNASIAVDECDFGTGLELGIDLFCSGLKELQSIAFNNLIAAYGVLNRKPFAQIAEAHLKYRRKGSNMSLLSLGKSK